LHPWHQPPLRRPSSGYGPSVGRGARTLESTDSTPFQSIGLTNRGGEDCDCLSGSSRMLAISRQREPRPVTHLTCLATGELSVRARPSAGGYEQDAGFASLTDLWHEVHTILGRVSSQSVGCKRRRSNHHRFLGPTPL